MQRKRDQALRGLQRPQRPKPALVGASPGALELLPSVSHLWNCPCPTWRQRFKLLI
jgi:hypothetical protein